jgi:hypothetical protein
MVDGFGRAMFWVAPAIFTAFTETANSDLAGRGKH